MRSIATSHSALLPPTFCGTIRWAGSGDALLVVLLEKPTQIYGRTFVSALQYRRQRIVLRVKPPAFDGEAGRPALTTRTRFAALALDAGFADAAGGGDQLP